MEHTVIYKREGVYAPFPVLDQRPDGRLAVGFAVSPARDHFMVGDWTVYASSDGGRSWAESDDPSLPHNWPGNSTREKWERFSTVLADGTYLCAGKVGWETWPLKRRSEAVGQGLSIQEHPWDAAAIVVGNNKMFFQRSSDAGATWDRQEWEVPAFGSLWTFPRSAQLADGTVLVPVSGTDSAGEARSYIWYSKDGLSGWKLVSMGAQVAGTRADEMALVEVSPGRVLAQSRNESGYFLEMWSDDGGRSWSLPVLTDIWAPHSPPDLLKLKDGRILCTYGYRRMPMGIRAVLSEDGGESWDTNNTMILREDGGTPTESNQPADVDPEGLRISGDPFRAQLRGTLMGARYQPERARPDLGYAMSAQLDDGSICTAYYITLADRVTHSVATRWEV